MLMRLQTQLEESDLFVRVNLTAMTPQQPDGIMQDDLATRRAVLGRAMPKTLVDKVGLDALMERLPAAYQRSLFAR